jgi:hypothetical protein
MSVASDVQTIALRAVAITTTVASTTSELPALPHKIPAALHHIAVWQSNSVRPHEHAGPGPDF